METEQRQKARLSVYWSIHDPSLSCGTMGKDRRDHRFKWLEYDSVGWTLRDGRRSTSIKEDL